MLEGEVPLTAPGTSNLMNVPTAFGPGTSVAAWVRASRPAAAFAAAAARKSGCCAYNCQPQTISSAPATVQTCCRFIIANVMFCSFAIEVEIVFILCSSIQVGVECAWKDA